MNTLDDRYRRHEGPYELTRSQEESGVMASWCFIAFLVGLTVLGLLNLLGIA